MHKLKESWEDYSRQGMLTNLWKWKADEEVSIGLEEQRNLKSQCLIPNWSKGIFSIEMRKDSGIGGTKKGRVCRMEMTTGEPVEKNSGTLPYPTKPNNYSCLILGKRGLFPIVIELKRPQTWGLQAQQRAGMRNQNENKVVRVKHSEQWDLPPPSL